MRQAFWFALLCGPALAGAQERSRVKALLDVSDTAALRAEVQRRPNDARDVLSDLIGEAGRHRSTADSVISVAFSLASAYANVWSDSFPLENLQRFARMSPEWRLAKTAADSIRLAGNDAYGRRGPAAAIARWRLSYRRSRDIGDTAGMAAALGNIGAGLYRLARLDSAEAYLDRARQLAEVVDDKRTALNAIGMLGSLAKDRGDLERAAGAYRHALELRSRIGDVVGASSDHNNLGLIAAAVGDEAAARRHYTEALKIARDHELDDAVATALLNLGNLASGDADYEDAFAEYGEALSLDRRLENYGDIALALENLGLLELRTGDYRAAREKLLEALPLFAKVGTPEDLIAIRRDLAAASAAMGDLREALKDLREAERLLASNRSTPLLAAPVALAHGDVALHLNDYREAERQYSVAEQLYRHAGDAVGDAEARQGIASLLIRREQFAPARAQLEAILRAQVAAAARRPAALTRLSLGYVHEAERDTSGARAMMQKAHDSLRALGDVVGEAAAALALGGLALEERAPLAAEEEFRNGIGLLGTHSVPNVAWQLHLGLSRALRARGATGEAIKELRAAIRAVEKVATTLPTADRRSIYLTDKWEPYAELALVDHAAGADGEAFAVSEQMRARQMLSILARAAMERTATADSSTINRERHLRREIAELTQKLEGAAQRAASDSANGSLRGPRLGNAESGVTREALARAQEDYEHLLIEMQDEYVAIPQGEPGAATWRTVAHRLRGDQAMLEYLITDSTTLVFVVRSDTIRTLDLGVGRAALAPLIEFTRDVLNRASDGTKSVWRTPLRRLYATLIAPVEDGGLLGGVRELVIVPHGELHYVPFAALVRTTPRDEFLVERYDVGYAPSASVWLRIRDRRQSTNANVLAMAPRARTLPGTRDEVQAIRAVYGADATILSDADASERAFRDRAGEYGIVHLATYGVLNQHNPLFSFVELSADSANDGRLEVHEVLDIPLRARLVVLSACQTGLGSGIDSDVPPGDDWVGLVRAFLGAGAQHVIATLWPVEDRSTARLMERLHRKLRAGMTTVSALSDAQREALRNAETAGPFYWAGVVVVGGNTP